MSPLSRRPLPLPARRGGGALILIVLITLLIILLLYFGNFGGKSYMQQVSSARKQGQEMNVQLNTQQLLTLIVQFKLSNDRLPQTLEELDAPPGAFNDPWGNPITFTYNTDAPGDPRTVTFRSRGPDAEPDTPDDITMTEPLPI